MADAAFSLAQEPVWSPWRGEALWLLGEAYLLAGHLDKARDPLIEASAAAATTGNADTIVISESELAWLAMERGDWQEAADRLAVALATIDENRIHDYVTSLLAFSGAAGCPCTAVTRKKHTASSPARCGRLSVTYVLPFAAVRLRLQLARVYLALAEPATARQLLREIDDIVSRRPALGTLVDEVRDFRDVLASRAAPKNRGTGP